MEFRKNEIFNLKTTAILRRFVNLKIVSEFDKKMTNVQQSLYVHASVHSLGQIRFMLSHRLNLLARQV
jgi:hypothetical protein